VWVALPVIALVLPGLGYLALRSRARDAGERLVAKANEVEGRKYPRTLHRSEPGAFGARVVAALKGHTPDKEWTDACTKVARGDEPLDTLTEACDAVRLRDRAWALEAMRAGRSEQWSRVPPDFSLLPFMYAVRVTALEVRKLPPDEGVELCADVLAVGRDTALGGGALGAMVGAGIVELVHLPCTAALAGASDEKRAWGRQALRGIYDAWPQSGDWVPAEALFITSVFQYVMTDEQVARLPAETRGARLAMEEPTFFERLFLMQAFPGAVTMFDRLEQAGKLEPAKRDAEVAAIEAAEAASWNPLTRVAAPSYQKFFTRADAARAELLELARP